MAADLTREDVVRALDAGELQMMRPWGDYVPVRRRAAMHEETSGGIAVFMENQVEGVITRTDERMGFRGFRVVKGNPNAASKAGA